MVGEALQAQNIIPAPLITLQVKSATQYPVLLLYQHGSVTPDTFQYAKGMITREIAAAFMLMLKHGAHRK